MPDDICMCDGEGCPIKDDCYRFTAIPDMLQTWFMKSPIKDDKCDYLMSVKKIKLRKTYGQRVKEAENIG